jgi:integrase
MLLTDIVVKNLTNAGRYTDDQTKGLHLWVKPTRQRYWIFRYTNPTTHVRQNMSLGAYPTVNLKLARQKALKARHAILEGNNPIESKKTSQKVASSPITPFFSDFAQDYIATMSPKWRNPKHVDQWTNTLKTYAFPVIGSMPLDAIGTEHIEKILSPIWNTKTVTATRVMGRLEKILAAAKTRGYREGMNPAIWRGHLDTILPSPKAIRAVKHHSALPYRDLPELIARLQKLDGIAALALEYTILNASRTGEVLGGLKTEVLNDIWTIPAERMKAHKDHRVPLCQRAIEILKISQSLDKTSPYLFSINGKKLSGMAMPMLLRRLKLTVTVHGFRSTFRDWVSEETYHSPEVAEMALAHTIQNKVESAYRRGDLLPRRRELMRDWETYCVTGTLSNVLTFPERKIA